MAASPPQAPIGEPGSRIRGVWSWDLPLADKLLLRVASGESVRGACREITREIQAGTLRPKDARRKKLCEAEVRWWSVKDFDGFAAEMAEARRQQQHALVDECYEEARWLMDLAAGKPSKHPRTGEIVPTCEDPRLIGARSQAFREYREQVHWQAARLAPRDFNQRLALEDSRGLDLPFDVDEELRRRLENLSRAPLASLPRKKSGDAEEAPVH